MTTILADTIKNCFQEGSKNLNRERANEQEQTSDIEPSTSNDKKGKRKVGPAQLPKGKKSKIGNDPEEEELNVYVSQNEYNTEDENIVDYDPNESLFNVLNAAGESEVDSDSDEDLIKSLEADFQLEDKCQDKINPQLATAIDNVWRLKLSKEKIKERLDKHYRPENCEQLIMTKVNPELFSILPKHATMLVRNY